MASATQIQPTVSTPAEPGVLDRAAAALEAAVPKLPRHAGRVDRRGDPAAARSRR